MRHLGLQVRRLQSAGHAPGPFGSKFLVPNGPGCHYARYSGDGPHVYRSASEDVHGMLLVGYRPPDPSGFGWLR